MSGFEVSRSIAAPIEEVFDAATDLRSAPDRVSGIVELEVLTDGPVGAGTRFREKRIMFGKEATEEMEIQDFDPPNRYSVRAENHGCLYLSEFRFQEENDGTLVTFAFESKGLTTFAKIMLVLTKPLMKTMIKCVVQDLDDIKAYMEGRPAKKVGG
ncbi:MAG: SRPBCC family protein [Deltaproteobacteria bacterium]|nr:SRPBCC family protein [Deltaproteobacteria bacterium]